MLRNQSGVTMIELLASVALATIIAGIAFCFFFINVSAQSKVIDSTGLQNDSATVLAQLTNEVQMSEGSEFTIQLQNGHIQVNEGSDTSPNWKTIGDNNYDYSGSTFIWQENNDFGARIPTQLIVHLVVSTEGDSSQGVTTDTVLSYQWNNGGDKDASN